jgi:hypothetical protein
MDAGLRDDLVAVTHDGVAVDHLFPAGMTGQHDLAHGRKDRSVDEPGGWRPAPRRD